MWSICTSPHSHWVGVCIYVCTGSYTRTCCMHSHNVYTYIHAVHCTYTGAVHTCVHVCHLHTHMYTYVHMYIHMCIHTSCTYFVWFHIHMYSSYVQYIHTVCTYIHVYGLYVHTVCMGCMYILYVWAVCMYILYVWAVFTYCMYGLYVCTYCMYGLYVHTVCTFMTVHEYNCIQHMYMVEVCILVHTCVQTLICKGNEKFLFASSACGLIQV